MLFLFTFSNIKMFSSLFQPKYNSYKTENTSNFVFCFHIKISISFLNLMALQIRAYRYSPLWRTADVKKMLASLNKFFQRTHKNSFFCYICELLCHFFFRWIQYNLQNCTHFFHEIHFEFALFSYKLIILLKCWSDEMALFTSFSIGHHLNNHND